MALLFLLICLATQMSSCKSDEKVKQTTPPSRTPGTSANDTTKPAVYFGVISRYNPRIMFEEYQPIMDYLTANTPYRFVLKLGKTYEDAVDFLCKNDVQVASLGGLTYLEAHKRCGAQPVVRPLNKTGKAFYRSIIVVRKDNPIQTLADLKGHSVAFASRHSTSGNLVPRYELAKAGIHVRDFSIYTNLKHHDMVAKAVLKGEFDAGAVKDIIAYKYLQRGLKILHISAAIPSVPIVARRDCDPKIVAALKKALLGVDPQNPAHRVFLASWNAEFRYGFTEARDADYDILRKIAKTVPSVEKELQ